MTSGQTKNDSARDLDIDPPPCRISGWRFCRHCWLPFRVRKPDQIYCCWLCEKAELEKPVKRGETEYMDILNVLAWTSDIDSSVVLKGADSLPLVRPVKHELLGYCWDIQIDIDTGEVQSWPKGVEARTYLKTSDTCEIRYCNRRQMDYVPGFLQIFEDGYGDFVHVEVGADGRIRDWNSSACRAWLASKYSKMECL